MLFAFNSLTYSEQNFKHDSVIPPLKLGEYKILNGCPAILKTETKTEDNCPVDYTGNIEYERTLTADKILFGAGDAIQKNASGGIEVKLLNGNTLSVVGMMNIFSGAGLAIYNGTTDTNSTKLTLIQGGVIKFAEWSP